jgi:hypothetical protein
MEFEIWITVIFLVLIGTTSLIVGIDLLNRFKKARLKETLALALYALSYATANFLWAVGDSILVGNTQVAVLAYIFEYIPAYLGVLFSVFIVGIRPKLIISTASAIIGAAIVCFLLFPLEYEFIGGI